MICNKCGAELNPEDKFCTSCGTPVNPLPDEVKYGPKAENADVPQQANATPTPQPPVEDPYTSLDPATNPVNTQNTSAQSTPNNDFVAPMSGESNAQNPGANPQYTPNTVGPQSGNNNAGYNPQYNPNLNTNKKSHVGCIVAIIIAVILIPLIIIGIVFGGIFFAAKEFSDEIDNTVSSYNYTSKSSNTTPYSYSYGNTASVNQYTNTSTNTTVGDVSIKNNQDNTLYSYINDVAVQYKVPLSYTKAVDESTATVHCFYSGTRLSPTSIVVMQLSDDASSYEALSQYSGYGYTSETTNINGREYQKVSVSSDLMSIFAANTVLGTDADDYDLTIYYTKASDKVMYQTVVIVPKTATTSNINPNDFLDIKVGSIDY